MRDEKKKKKKLRIKKKREKERERKAENQKIISSQKKMTLLKCNSIEIDSAETYSVKV